MIINGYKFGIVPNNQILAQLDALAPWFHRCFTTSVNHNDNPWGFTPENWRVGPVDDRDSASFFLWQLAQWGAYFHLVTKEEDYAALAITVRLNEVVLADPRYQLAQWGAAADDLYFAVYCVCPLHRGEKLASKLIDHTVVHGRTIDPAPKSFFVRTHAGHEDRVIHSFNERNVHIVGRYDVQQFGNTTPRVVMGGKFRDMKTLVEART